MHEHEQENSGLRNLAFAALSAPHDEASEYRELECAFLQHGGLVESETLTTLLHRRMDQPISKL